MARHCTYQPSTGLSHYRLSTESKFIGTQHVVLDIIQGGLSCPPIKGQVTLHDTLCDVSLSLSINMGTLQKHAYHVDELRSISSHFSKSMRSALMCRLPLPALHNTLIGITYLTYKIYSPDPPSKFF